MSFLFFKQLTIVHLDNLIGYLVDETYQDYVLDILYSISNQVPIALEPYLCIFEKFTCYDSFKIDKIISTIGKSLKVIAFFKLFSGNLIGIFYLIFFLLPRANLNIVPTY